MNSGLTGGMVAAPLSTPRIQIKRLANGVDLYRGQQFLSRIDTGGIRLSQPVITRAGGVGVANFVSGAQGGLRLGEGASGYGNAHVSIGNAGCFSSEQGVALGRTAYAGSQALAIGTRSYAPRPYEFSMGTGAWSVNMYQTTRLLSAVVTTDATPTIMAGANNSTTGWSVISNSFFSGIFTLHAIGSNGSFSAFTRLVKFENRNGTTVLHTIESIGTDLNPNLLGFTISANDTTDKIEIEVVGEADVTYNWHAQVFGPTTYLSNPYY